MAQVGSGNRLLRPGLLVLGLVALIAALLVSERFRLELEFFYKSRVAPQLSATRLQVEATPGLRIFLQPDDTVITPAVLGWGEWEPTETHWFSRLLRPGDTFVDVGANVGYFSLVASRLVGREGRVIAFEPDPVAFSLLEKNVRLNRLDNVELVPKAASNAKGTLQLYLAQENRGDHRIYQTDEGRFAIDVEAVVLDDYLANEVGEIDLVKIDTQGAEGVILDGMQAMLSENPDIMLAIEFWPAGLANMGYDGGKVLENLRAHDFLFFDLGPGPEMLAELRVLSDRDLLEGLTVENDLFTNLLMIKGFAAMRRLTQDVAKHRAQLFEQTPELKQARVAWEAEALAGEIEGTLPPAVAAALAVAADSRSDVQEQSLENYLRATTPLLAEARRDLSRARAQRAAFRDRLLAPDRVGR